MIIRNATIEDLDELYEIEKECFPPNEAVKKDDLKERLEVYPNHFWLLVKGEKIVSFINGFTTNENDLNDEMYENASLHDENGSWQMIFGLNTLPEFEGQGFAGKLINQVIDCAQKENRLGIVLTCKKELISYYLKFGFVDEGISESQHGGVVWHQMRLEF